MDNNNKLSICALGSGSRGNSFAVSSSFGTVLVDAGFSCKELLKRLSARRIDPESIQGVLLTHEHSDHVCGCRVFCDLLNIPLYLSNQTMDFLHAKGGRSGEKLLPRRLVQFEPGDDFELAGFGISPFSIPHDAIDPVGFVLDYAGKKIGIATDLGEFNALSIRRLSNCSVLVIESNYDQEMLFNSDRRLNLKQRINGRSGHLNNVDAVNALPQLLGKDTQVLMLVHVSRDCNDYDLVHRIADSMIARLGRMDVRLEVVKQSEPGESIFLK